MKETNFLRRSALCAAATAISAAGLLNGAAPAQAMPPLPRAPGDCQQWSFPGQVTIRRTTGELITFNSTGPGASGPAQWKHADGPTRQGSVAGAIDPSGQVNFSFIFAKDNTTADFSGKVGPDGKANGTSPTDVQWSSLAPMTCAQAAASKEGPGVSFDLVIGGLVAHITDRSGVDSQCQYQADFFSRAFFLPKNSTVDLRIVPAIPKLQEWDVSVTCDNGTSTNTSTFF